MRTIRTAVLIAAIFVSGSAVSQEDLHPSLNSKYWVDIGGYYPEHSVTLGVEGPDPIFDGRIDLEGSLDLTDRKGLWNLEIGWQFGEKWSVAAQYFETNRDEQFVLEKEVEWDDLIYEVGVGISAGTDASVTRIYFSRKMLERGRHDLRLGAGFHWLSVGAHISGAARIDDQTTEFRSSSVSASAPLPNFGAWYRYSPSDKWAFSLRGDWLGASVGDISGELINLLVGVNYRLFNNVGVGLNYQRFSLNGRVEKNSWRGDLDIVYEGPQIVISGYW